MSQLYNIRLPNGDNVVPGDFTTAEPLYSTVEVAPGAFTVLSAFSYGRGGDVPGSAGPRVSNYADTNLEGEGSRIPENEELFIYSLAVEVFLIGEEDAAVSAPMPASAAPFISLQNMLRLQRDLLVVTRIGADAKTYTHAPLSYFPAGTGVASTTSAGRVNLTGVLLSGFVDGNNGGYSSFDNRELASPLHVAGGEIFAVDFRPGPGQVTGLNLDQTPSAGTVPLGRARLRVFAEGLRRRPIA